MSSPPNQELREFHRIRYPISERPTFLHEGKAYPVMDVSVQGLRYAIPGGPVPPLHQPIKGILRFRRGPSINIQGKVVRTQEEQVALYLDQEIPAAILFTEQRYLHKHYPTWS